MSQSAHCPQKRHAFRPSSKATAHAHANAAPNAADRSSLPAREEGLRQPGVPFWMPKKDLLHAMSPKFRQAVAELIDPAYQDLVVAADTPMAKNIGVSVVYLLWLELLEQFDFKLEDSNTELCRITGTDRSESLNRYLKLLGAKLRLSQFLLRLRELRLKEAQGQSASTFLPVAFPAAEPLPLNAAPAANHSPLPANPEELDSWKNQEPLSKTETENQEPSWKYQETLSKTETETQAPKAKTEDQPWNNQELLSKTETESQDQQPKAQDASWKNQELLTKTPTFENQDLKPKPEDRELWKNDESAPKSPLEAPRPEAQLQYIRPSSYRK